MQFDDQKQQSRLDELYKREEEDLVRILALKYEIPYLDLTAISVNTDALKLIPEAVAREAGAAVFHINGKKLSLVVISPKNDKINVVLDDLKRAGYEVTLYMGSKKTLGKAWDMYKEVSLAAETQGGVFDISATAVRDSINQIKDIAELKQLLTGIANETNRYKISKILEIILGGAIAIHASDVHFEPEEKQVRLRFRLDGVLQDFTVFKNETFHFLLSRIKLLSGLKLNIKEAAQDGRFSIKLETGEIEIRTSMLPGEYGESIVLRILNPENINVSFDSMGIEPMLFNIIEKEIQKPNGMILTTGPTGSGKTTTLYAFMRKVYTPEIKIITIEDPIEYHLSGISQTQVNKAKDYTFLNGLRSALRQDPDIIMVGEIRDGETAEVAVNSALTGHLVFSTLHTNDAAGVIPRLIDLGINPKIISSALNISLAQRLVRKLCQTCKKEDRPSEAERALIEHTIETIKQKRDIALDASKVWRAKTTENTCPACNGLGYKGRIGIFEAILTDRAVEDVIVTSNPSAREIKKAAIPQNILDMREDGIIKVLSGITSLDELRRVVDMEAV
ncbi:MAG: type II/IV secretion system protein [Patescibacteria group bacterium]|nr:type II/IV secretion system protein [Patescibacteria group bacterium]